MKMLKLPMKLSILTLSCGLLLTACGGGDTNAKQTKHPDNGSPNIPVNPALSEMDQAKSLVKTAHLFVNDYSTIQGVYENMSNVLTDKQQMRLQSVISVPKMIHQYMQENNKSSFDSKDFEKWQKTHLDYGDVHLKPNKDFTANLEKSGKFILNGSAVATTYETRYEYNSKTHSVEKIPVNEDTFDIAYKGFENNLESHAKVDNINRNYGFESLKIGKGKDIVTVTASKNSGNIQASFSDKIAVTDKFDIDDMHNQDILMNKVVMTLQGIKLVANDSIINAKELKLAFLDISTKTNNKPKVKTIPYQVVLTGQLIKKSPKTDITLSLNATANDNDIKNYLDVSTDNWQEQKGKYIGMTATMSLKGTVAKVKSATIPLDLIVSLKRTARDKVVLNDLTANVDGKALYITGNAKVDSNYQIENSQITIKQNNAYINLMVDKDNEFVTQGAGKLGDIKVGDKAYGQLYDNGGKVMAKFNDKSVMTL